MNIPAMSPNERMRENCIQGWTPCRLCCVGGRHTGSAEAVKRRPADHMNVRTMMGELAKVLDMLDPTALRIAATVATAGTSMQQRHIKSPLVS
jgi:hypothetical protein